jgi:membrane-bound inhibitor of C-type lysozyme
MKLNSKENLADVHYKCVNKRVTNKQVNDSDAPNGDERLSPVDRF